MRLFSRSFGNLLLVILIAIFGLFGGVGQVRASTGDVLRSIFINPIPDCFYFSAGLAFDGRELLLSCTVSNTITRVSPVDGRNLGAYTVDGISAIEGIAGMSWDAQNNRLWVGSARARPHKIYTVTLDRVAHRGTATLRFTHAQAKGESWLSGVTFDSTDGTIWLGPGGQTNIYHYAQTGDFLSSFDAARFAPYGKTGLAVGSAAKLYVANDGGSQIFSVNKDGSSPALFANVPAGKRVEDLECDGNTFAPKSVIWSNYSFDNYELNAFEVPSGECPAPQTPLTPLILIPGIAGSELKSDQTFTSTIKDCGILPEFSYGVNDIVWVNTKMALISPCDDYFDILKLKADGQTPEYPQVVLSGAFLQRFYGDFIKFFTDNGHDLNKTLFIFPYDWRLDISGTASLLDQKIQSVKTETGSDRVDIIAHSMGGLVARNYIADSEKAKNVRKLFTLGTPHLGSVKSLKTLLYGDCLALEFGPFCLSINQSEVKDVIKNMISGYELVPSQEYFNFYNGQDINHPYPYKTESGTLNYTQIKNLLTSLSFNTSLFNPSETFHALDNSLPNTNDVDVTVITGSGQPTLGQIIEEKRISLLGVPYIHKDMININGDEIVPLFSASLNDAGRNKSLFNPAKVFYTNQEHGNLVASGPALNLVKNILNNDNQLPNGVSVQPYHFSGAQISVHSPVNIHVYDSLGNHTGPTSDGDFEANIPGSSYDTLDDAKFIFLPDNGNYNIKFEATDRGNFDFKIRKFENDINTFAVLYNDIPLTNSTKGETNLDTSSNEPPILQIDQDGNGIIDKTVNPTVILTGDEVYDETVPEANIHFDTQLRDIVLTGLDNVSQTNIAQTQISKNKEQVVITDKSENTLILTDTDRAHGSNSVFSITSLSYNSVPAVIDTNKLSIKYQVYKNGAVKSFSQTFEIKGVVKIQLSYDPKTNKTTVAIGKQKEIADGMRILQISTEKGSLKYSY